MTRPSQPSTADTVSVNWPSLEGHPVSLAAGYVTTVVSEKKSRVRIESKTCPVCGELKPASEYNRSSVRADGLQWQCQICDRASNKKKRLRRRLKAIELLGGKCAHCGNDDFRVLQIDHINNDGYLEGKNRSDPMMRDIYTGRRSIDDLQLLCANCHHIKSYGNVWL